MIRRVRRVQKRLPRGVRFPVEIAAIHDHAADRGAVAAQIFCGRIHHHRRAMIEGPLTAACPASALQMHRKATVVLDAAAASKLALRDYYEEVHPDGRDAPI